MGERAGEAGGGGNLRAAGAAAGRDEDSLLSDGGPENAPVACPTPATAPSVVSKAAELELEAQAKLSKTPMKNKKETAASVLREYLQAKTAPQSPGSAGDEASNAAGTGGPAEVSAGEVRLAVVITLNAFAEKARGH